MILLLSYLKAEIKDAKFSEKPEDQVIVWTKPCVLHISTKWHIPIFDFLFFLFRYYKLFHLD